MKTIKGRIGAEREELEELHMLTNKLLDVGVAISSEIDLFSLLTRIIDEAKKLLHSEKGTLYLVDSEKNELYFYVTDAAMLKEIRIPISTTSIAGYVALKAEPLNIDDVYRISNDKPYTFNQNIDEKTGYRTISMLTVPMVNHSGEITGAVQLINKIKKDKVTPFSERDQRILLSLASQAAVSIENAQLYKEVADLLSAIVRYSTSAIDERDPATAGHSRRVAMYAVATARALGTFTEDELRELEYAAWLHDIGKIGVREHILVKENKLYPDQILVIRERFNSIRLSAKLDFMRKTSDAEKLSGTKEEIERLEVQLNELNKEIEDDLAFIERVNKPGFTPQQDQQRVDDIARKTYTDSSGAPHNYLTTEESLSLKVVRGNLTDEERGNMNAHVDSTFKILKQIPFSKRLNRVPAIACYHHERLDGTGYPNGLKGEDIPIQSRILALVDVYDALTAQDRPYKPAIPVQKSIDILESEVKSGKLDGKVFEVFIANKIYELHDMEPSAKS